MCLILSALWCAEFTGHTHRVHTEWQLPLSGVHSNMMEKLAQPGEGGGCTSIPIHYIYTITYKVEVYAPAEWAGPLPLFLLLLYPYMFSVVTH